MRISAASIIPPGIFQSLIIAGEIALSEKFYLIFQSIPYTLSFFAILMSIQVAIADDEKLFLQLLSDYVEKIPNFKVPVKGMNGQDLLEKLERLPEPVDIVLMDVNMPFMDGAAATKALLARFPSTKVVALSVKDDDFSILRMIRAGCCAYLAKGIEMDDIKKGLTEVHETGYYTADLISTNYRRLLQVQQMIEAMKLSERELKFLNLCVSELTYKEIAQQMYLSEKTIDGYREALFQKLNVKTRTGMAIVAIKYQLVKFP